MQNPLSYLPPRARTYTYLGLAVLGLVLGCLVIGYATIEAAQPDWLKIALAVTPFIMTTLGFTASTHVPSSPDAQVTRALRLTRQAEQANATRPPGAHRDQNKDGIADGAQLTPAEQLRQDIDTEDKRFNV
jgi:hypothetical protein